MNKTRLFLAFSAIAAALLLPGAARATGTLDQQQTDISGSALVVSPSIEDIVAMQQTFTAGVTGELDQVDLYLGRSADGYGLESVLVRVAPVGSPAAAVATRVTAERIPAGAAQLPAVGAWISIPIGPLAVTAGTQYELSLCCVAATGGSLVRWWLGSGDVYAGGSASFVARGGIEELFEDFAFKTYVVPRDTTPPENFRASLTVAVTCTTGGTLPDCVFDGSAMVPHLGPVTVTGSIQKACVFVFDHCDWVLHARLTPTGNHGGRILDLLCAAHWQPDQPAPAACPWDTREDLGYIGSGTLTDDFSYSLPDGGQFTINLTGTLKPVH